MHTCMWIFACRGSRRERRGGLESVRFAYFCPACLACPSRRQVAPFLRLRPPLGPGSGPRYEPVIHFDEFWLLRDYHVQVGGQYSTQTQCCDSAQTSSGCCVTTTSRWVGSTAHRHNAVTVHRRGQCTGRRRFHAFLAAVRRAPRAEAGEHSSCLA